MPESCLDCGAPLARPDASCSKCGAISLSKRPLLEGKWRLEKKLGSGGMGTVHLATELELDRRVAIKMLSPGLAHESEVVTRFEREARMLAKLEHQNLVPILSIGRRDGQPFIVMKYLDGTTLSEFMRKRGQLPLDEVLELIRQISAGLGMIHSKGVVHRDLKPGNIIVSPDGHATLLDLGVAHDPRS
ncbi:MAG: serine/threonine protein kinase, partial [Myxococcaceae bacterium]